MVDLTQRVPYSRVVDDARRAWRGFVDLFMSDEVHNRFHDASASIGLPHPGSLKALLVIDPDDAPPMRALAESMHCDASYMTGLIDALERLGYVERRVADSDRRMKLVHLTPAGKEAQQRAIEVITTPPKVLSVLSTNETKTLAKLMEKLTGAPHSEEVRGARTRTAGR